MYRFIPVWILVGCGGPAALDGHWSGKCAFPSDSVVHPGVRNWDFDLWLEAGDADALSNSIEGWEPYGGVASVEAENGYTFAMPIAQGISCQSDACQPVADDTYTEMTLATSLGWLVLKGAFDPSGSAQGACEFVTSFNEATAPVQNEQIVGEYKADRIDRELPPEPNDFEAHGHPVVALAAVLAVVVVVIVVILVARSGPVRTEPDPPPAPVPAPCSDEDFEALKANLRAEGPCSPTLPEGWLGIVLVAPGTVQVPAEGRPKTMVVGRWRADFEGSRVGPTLHIQNKATGETRSVTLREVERTYTHEVVGMNVSYSPEPKEGPEVWKRSRNRMVGSWFQVDLQVYVGRPEVETVIEVSASFGPLKSEPVHIQVRPQDS